MYTRKVRLRPSARSAAKPAKFHASQLLKPRPRPVPNRVIHFGVRQVARPSSHVGHVTVIAPEYDENGQQIGRVFRRETANECSNSHLTTREPSQDDSRLVTGGEKVSTDWVEPAAQAATALFPSRVKPAKGSWLVGISPSPAIC